MNISGTSMLGDDSNGTSITLVNAVLNGSQVGITYVTSGAAVTTCQSFIGNPLLSGAVVTS